MSVNDVFGSVSDSRLREEVYDLLYTKHRAEVAVLRLNRILEEEPGNVEALSLKAYALNRLANTSENWKYSRSALETSEKALTFDPVNDLALTSKGWALIDLGKAKDSIPFLIRATTANTRNEYAWYNLAWAQYLTGDFVESSISIAKALELSPNNAIIRRGKQMMTSGILPSHLKHKSASE